MTVLERSELQASTLSDLHSIADQLGLDGFRRLRKEELIDAILGDAGDAPPAGEPRTEEPEEPEESDERPARSRRRRLVRSRRGSSAKEEASSEQPSEEGAEDDVQERPRRGRSRRSASAKEEASTEQPSEEGGEDDVEEPPARGGRSPREGSRSASAREAEGVVELLGNGSAFLRVSPPDASDDDVYISAAQVRRCELVSGDRVTGPVRTPRRSERYASLVRIDTINGDPADAVAGGTRYDELPVAYPSDRLALSSSDPTLQAIEWLTPLGRGSRAVIVGASRAGKTETLRRLLEALAGREDLQLTLVLAGARPEEIAAWQEGPVQPAASLTFSASPDTQAQAVERAVDEARRVAARGGDALVLIDSLDGLEAHAARKVLAAARNLREGGSLTIIATATLPLGGETTVIALDVALTSSGREPILDLAASGTLRPELLVGEDGARAITRARAGAIEQGARET